MILKQMPPDMKKAALISRLELIQGVVESLTASSRRPGQRHLLSLSSTKSRGR